MARKVLIVEDDPSVRRSLTRLLTAIGFEVASAASVGEALGALDGKDIAVIDLHLPDALGTVLINKIRREGRPIRTVIWTADPGPLEPHDRQPQPDAFFQKPEIDGLLEWLGEP